LADETPVRAREAAGSSPASPTARHSVWRVSHGSSASDSRADALPLLEEGAMCHRVRAGGRGGAGPGSGAFSVARTLRRRTSSPAEATRADEAPPAAPRAGANEWLCRVAGREPRQARDRVRMSCHALFPAPRRRCELGLPETCVREALASAMDSFSADDYARPTRPE